MFIILSFIGSLLAGLSIFAMFGKVASHPEVSGSTFINMFQAAFGKNASSTVVTGLLVLFVFALIVIILVAFNIIFIIKKDTKKVLIISSVILAFTLIDSILSFCTLKMLDIPSGLGFKLGAGPIIYSILNLLALGCFVVAIIFHFVKRMPLAYQGKRGDSDSDTADTLAKYKKLLDDGAITKEEYNKKKQKLLDK